MTHSTTTDDPTLQPWATTRTEPYAASPPAPAAGRPTPGAAMPRPEPEVPSTAPALTPPPWSGRKTAIAAALAIGISSAGAIGAAAALPAGSTQNDTGQFQRGGAVPGQQFPGGPGQQGQRGQQLPEQQLQQGTQLPGQSPPAPTDPNAGTT